MSTGCTKHPFCASQPAHLWQRHLLGDQQQGAVYMTNCTCVQKVTRLLKGAGASCECTELPGGTERQMFLLWERILEITLFVSRREESDHCELCWCGELPRVSIAVNPVFSWCFQFHVSCVSAFLLLWATRFCILTLLSCFNILITCSHLPLILPQVLLLSLCVSIACELRYVIYHNPNLTCWIFHSQFRLPERNFASTIAVGCSGTALVVRQSQVTFVGYYRNCESSQRRISCSLGWTQQDFAWDHCWVLVLLCLFQICLVLAMTEKNSLMRGDH